VEKWKTKGCAGKTHRERSGVFAMSAKNTTPSTRRSEKSRKRFGGRRSRRITRAQAGVAWGRFSGSARRTCTIGLKKTAVPAANEQTYELDELYHFVERKGTSETRENTYVIAMVSRLPRQIVAVDAAFDKSPERIQALVDGAPEAENYCTDGFWGYVDVVYPGKHVRNVHNKNDTFTVESVNADLRHYIPILRRRSRCFPRSLETLNAVLEVFAEAYNAFGIAKMKFRHGRDPNARELPFSVLDFL